ncbi:MAG: ABC transporter ATP-binding protein [Phycisphaerae bacterium]|nr:ABC transporter ATP-binding protein [Phycisphaerae bacterium]
MEGERGPAEARNILEVRDLLVRFPRRSGLLGRRTGWTNAVDGVSFDIEAGRTLGLVGESGCGKTTVGRAVLGLIAAAGGAVRFEGADLRHSRGARLRAKRREMQMVFQDPGGSLNPRMRIGAIVGEPLLVHGVERRGDALLRRVGLLLEKCGMPADSVDRYPHQFSGGQKQRIAIARAIALSPRLIVCDEPTSALDVSVQAQILNLLKDLQRELGVSYLFISHDMNVMQHVCDRIAVMNGGRIVEEGPANRVLSSPRDEYTKRLLSAVPVADPTRRHERGQRTARNEQRT